MTVREYIEQNKEKFLGHKVRIWDCDYDELLSFRLKKETDLDNIKDALVQQIIDDELLHINIYDNVRDPQLILISNCEL